MSVQSFDVLQFIVCVCVCVCVYVCMFVCLFVCWPDGNIFPCHTTLCHENVGLLQVCCIRDILASSLDPQLIC